jgi:hypothetical protein
VIDQDVDDAADKLRGAVASRFRVTLSRGTKTADASMVAADVDQRRDGAST